MRDVPLMRVLGGVLALASCTSVPGEERIARFEGARLHYADHGPGTSEAIVLIHGWSCDSTLWTRQIEELSTSRRVIAIDLPGHGRSDAPFTFEYGSALFSRAIRTVLDQASVRTSIIVGHGMGAQAARQFALDHPASVKGLILISDDAAIFAGERRLETLSALRDSSYRHAAAEIASARLRTGDHRERTALAARMLDTPQHVMIGTLLTLDPAAPEPEELPDVPVLIIGNRPQPKPSPHTGPPPGSRGGVRYVHAGKPGELIMVEDPRLVSAEVARFADELLEPSGQQKR